MDNKILLERNILFPTGIVTDIGSIQVRIMEPKKSGKIPVTVRAISNHNLTEHLDTIGSMMQKEIMERIEVDLYENVDLYIVCNEALGNKYKSEYVKVDLRNGTFEGTDEIE